MRYGGTQYNPEKRPEGDNQEIVAVFTYETDMADNITSLIDKRGVFFILQLRKPKPDFSYEETPKPSQFEWHHAVNPKPFDRLEDAYTYWRTTIAGLGHYGKAILEPSLPGINI